MEYEEIPDNLRKYVDKTTYIGMESWDRVIYYTGTKMIHRNLQEMGTEVLGTNFETYLDEYFRVCRLAETKMVPDGKYEIPVHNSPIVITFVGMRFLQNHIFDPLDQVHLEKDETNDDDPNAIKVMVKNSKGKWKHEAYVCRTDAKRLRIIRDFEKKPLKFQTNFDHSSKYYFG